MVDYIRARKLGRTLLRALLYALPVVPSMVLLALYVENNRDLETATVINWGGVPRKLSVPLTVFRGYSTTADVAAFLLWAAAAVSIFGVTAIKGVRRDWLSLGLFAMIALYLVLPYQAQRTSDADSRLLPAILICAVACLGKLPLRRLAPGAVLLAASLVVRDGSIIRAWDRLSDRLASHARAFPPIERGGRVLPAVLLPGTSKEFPEAHFLCWAVIQRGAFVPSLFAYKEQQPLKLTLSCPDPLERGPQGYTINERTAQQYFDYAWVYNPKGERLLIPSGWRRLYSANSLTLWQIP
jgi:hypothetical protein